MMKNLNAEVILFDTAALNLNDDAKFDALGLRKTAPTFTVKKKGDDMVSIPELSLLLSISGHQELDFDNNPIRSEDDTPENTFLLNNRYQMCLRITEPESGLFVDLDIFDLAPYLEATTIPGFKIFNQRKLMKYQNVPVHASPNHTCVLKILIKHESEKKWTVQSIQEIKLAGDF